MRLRRPVPVLRQRMHHARTEPVFRRDPEFVRRWHPWVANILRWFRPEVRGGDHVPPRGPMLLVSTHSGGIYTPEAYVLLDWWIRARGPDAPLYLLAHDLLFAVPRFGEILRRGGGIPANRANARRALDEHHAALLVFPGGDHEAFRPWIHRGRVDFGGRTGFIRLALETGVPVVPIVSHGSHDTAFVVTRGERLARWFRMDRVRSKALPLVFGLPWGLTPGFVPWIPLPAQITMEILPPLDWRHLGPGAASDEDIVQRCYDELVTRMQARLRELVAERPLPWFRPRAGAAARRG